MTSDLHTSAFFASLSQESECNNDLDQNLVKICEDVENNLSGHIYDVRNPCFDEEINDQCENVEILEKNLRDDPYWGTLSEDEALVDICIKVEEANSLPRICPTKIGMKRRLTNGSESPAKYSAGQLPTPLRNTSSPLPKTTTKNKSDELTMHLRSYKSYPGVRRLLKSAWLKKAIYKTTAAIDETLSKFSEDCLTEYDVYLKKWYRYCARSNIDCHEAPVDDVTCFLKKLFYDGTSFDALCTCRSALALLERKNLCKEDKVHKIFKDIYHLQTSRNDVKLNTSIVLNFVAIFYPYDKITLEILSKKLITLLALGTAHSIKTIEKLNVADVTILQNKVMINVQNQMTSKGSAIQFVVPFFELPEICLGRAVVAYLERTKGIRGEEKRLFLSLNGSNKAVSARTLSKWVKEVITRSGVDASLLLK